MTDNPKDPEESQRFKIEDRRKFTVDGDPIPSREDPPRVAEPRGPSEPSRRGASESPLGDSRRPESERESTIDFASFVMSLAASAMAYLGEMPDPASGERSENLEGAQQMIDILSMLKEKTEGNLAPEEGRLLEDLLYELRMKYLTKRKLIKL